MTDMDALPIWLQQAVLAAWPTQVAESVDLRYRIGVPEAWEMAPTVEEGFNEIEHRYTGALAAESVSVAFMAQADPAASLRDWLEATIAMTGKPLLSPQMEMLEWVYAGGSQAVVERLAVDEAHLYTGLGELDEAGRPTLARLYVVLARRDQYAWKIIVSFSSACPPGTEEEMIERNDHVRAGAIFGRLALL
jgi:hypothetical protein